MTTKEEMIDVHLQGRDITDKHVLQAMQDVDRAVFVPEDQLPHAYEDRPLPIGRDQTISQPYIVAYMAQELGLHKNDRVLEIGTGCGYNAAILSRLCKEVYSVEIIEWLVEQARNNLKDANIKNVHAKHGNGYEGWPEKAPFDAIELTAAPPSIPEALKRQLKIGGKLLAPEGTTSQVLKLIERVGEDEYIVEHLLPVAFVPMTGENKP